MGFLDDYGLSASLPEKYGETELPFCFAMLASIYLTLLLSRVVRHGGHHIGILLWDSSRLFATRLCLLVSLRVNICFS
jgi:hypothetical protein